MLIQQRFIKFPCFFIFFCMTQWSENYVCLGTKKAYDNAHLKPRELADYTWQEVLYLLHPGIHYTDNSQNKSIWTETPIIGNVPGYYIHSPLHWLLIYFYIRNKKLQLTNSVLNTRHDLYQLLNAIWNVLFTSKHNFKRYIL